MSSQAQAYEPAPTNVVPLPRRHNTNRGRKFPPEPIRPEEFALMLEHCKPLRPAVEASREGIPLYSLQGQLGHARLDVTERYLRGIDPMERLAPFSTRKPPMIQVPSVYTRT